MKQLAVWMLAALCCLSLQSYSQANRFYRSRQSGNWNSTSTWEWSTDNANWDRTGLVVPTSASANIYIRNGHNVTLSDTRTVDQIEVQTGGQLIVNASGCIINSSVVIGTMDLNATTTLTGLTVRANGTAIIDGAVTVSTTVVDANGTLRFTNNGSLSIANSTGDDLLINGTLQDENQNGLLPSFATGSLLRVGTGGRIRINAWDNNIHAWASNGTGNLSANVQWDHQSVYEINIDLKNTANGFGNGLTFFPNAGSNTIPIFRLAMAPDNSGGDAFSAFGGSSATVINGLLEANATMPWQGTGTKTFRNGIIGTGSVQQLSYVDPALSAGAFLITGATSRLGGSGEWWLNEAGLTITAGMATVEANKTIRNSYDISYASCAFRVNAGATLDFQGFSFQLSSTYYHPRWIANNNSTIISAHASGLNGSMAWDSPKDFADSVHFTFDGTANQTMGSLLPATVGNLSIDNSSTSATISASNSTALRVKGNLNINRGILTLNATSGADLYVQGHFTRHFSNGGFTQNGRTVFFTGTGVSDISTPNFPGASGTPASQQQFGLLVIEKTNGGSVRLQTNTGVNNRLTLTSGLIDANAYALFIHNQAPDDNANNGIIGGSSTAYIDGVLYRQIQTNSSLSGNYSFPIGKSASHGYRPLMLASSTSASTAASLFKGEYFGGSGTVAPADATNDFFTGSVTGILRDAYWQLDRITGTVNARVGLQYSEPAGSGRWRNANNMVLSPGNGNNVAVVHGSASPNTLGGTTWGFTKADFAFATGGSFPETRPVQSSGWVWSNVLSSFSPFSIGFAGPAVLDLTLPVKLLSFEASWQQQDARLRWRIDSDRDLQYVEVWHSTDGRHYRRLQQLMPAGTQYQWLHTSPGAGLHYYQLTVVEKTGRRYQSAVQMLRADGRAANQVRLGGSMQNPLLLVESAVAQPLHYRLLDQQGRLLQAGSWPVAAGSQQLMLTNLPVQPGVYLIQTMLGTQAQPTLRWVRAQ